MTHTEDDIMALVFGGVNVEKTTTVVASSHSESAHVERVVTVTKSITHDEHGEHVTVHVEKEIGGEHGHELSTHSSATFEAHVEHSANGEHHLQLDSIHLEKGIETSSGEDFGAELTIELDHGDRSPSRLSVMTDATSVRADTYHVHPDHEEQEVHLTLGEEALLHHHHEHGHEHHEHHEEHHEKDLLPFRTAQQDALVAQFKEMHPPALPTSLPPSTRTSRRGTYIEETSVIDDPIEIDREHEAERIRIEAERVAELKRTLSKADEHHHHHHHHAHHHHKNVDYSSDEEGSVVPLSATHYEFDDRASVARTESFISHHSAKRDSIDLYQEEHHHEHPVAEKILQKEAEFEVAQYVEHKIEEHLPRAAESMAESDLHVHTPVVSPLTESVFMSPVSPVPQEHELESPLNPHFSGPHITDELKAAELLLEHEEHHHHHDHHHHHHHHHVTRDHVTRHDSVASAGAVIRALEEMDNVLQHHSSMGSVHRRPTVGSGSVPPSPAPSRDEGAYSLNGSVRSKHHLYEHLGYSRSSTPSGPPPAVPLWDLIKEEEVARHENVIDAPAPLHRAAPLSHLEEISHKDSISTHHSHDHLAEAALLAHHIHAHHEGEVHSHPASGHGSVRSTTSSRYGSKHAIGAGVVPVDRKSSVASDNSQLRSRGTTLTLVEGDRSRGSTLTEANVNGVLAHEHHHHHHHHTLGEVVAAHLIHEHVERRVQEEITKEIIHHHLESQSTIEYEHQKSVASLMSKFGGGEKKAYTVDEAAARRKIHEAERLAREALEHEQGERERRAAEEAAAAAAAVAAAEHARLAALRAAEEEAARHAAQAAAAAAIHHHEQDLARHSRSASVASHRSTGSHHSHHHHHHEQHVQPQPHEVAAPLASRRDSLASVRTTRSVVAHRHAASRDPFATLPRPPPQHHHMAGYTRNPMTSPSLVKKSPLHAAVDANKFSSVRVVRNVRGFIKEWGQKDFVPPARSPLSPTLAVWHEENNTSRRSSVVSEGGQSLIGRPAHIEAAPRHVIGSGAAPAPAVEERPVLTPLTERRREYEFTAAHTGLVEEKHHRGLPPMVDLLA